MNGKYLRDLLNDMTDEELDSVYVPYYIDLKLFDARVKKLSEYQPEVMKAFVELRGFSKLEKDLLLKDTMRGGIETAWMGNGADSQRDYAVNLLDRLIMNFAKENLLTQEAVDGMLKKLRKENEIGKKSFTQKQKTEIYEKFLAEYKAEIERTKNWIFPRTLTQFWGRFPFLVKELIEEWENK